MMIKLFDDCLPFGSIIKGGKSLYQQDLSKSSLAEDLEDSIDAKENV